MVSGGSFWMVVGQRPLDCCLDGAGISPPTPARALRMFSVILTGGSLVLCFEVESSG